MALQGQAFQLIFAHGLTALCNIDT